MLTLFTVPKPFIGHVAVIQLNAIQSWLRLDEACEVILFGDESGTEETARDLRLGYVPTVARTGYGTPLLNSVFDHVARAARHRICCYVNADIMLTRDLARAIKKIQLNTFLLAGQRWDVELREPWDFGHPEWEQRLLQHVAAHGTSHPPSGSDYFVFPAGTFPSIPAFAVGRPGWDNWLIYHARARRIPVVDCTRVVRVIHQNHGYDHVPGGRHDSWEGPEADYNRLVVGDWCLFTLEDADWVLSPEGLRRPEWSGRALHRRLIALAALNPSLRLLLCALWSLQRRVARALRWTGLRRRKA